MAIKDMLKHVALDDRVFTAHIIDLFDQVDRGKGARCTPFCDIHQVEIVRQVARQYDLLTTSCGGWSDAERVLFMISASEWDVPDMPIVPILLKTYGEVSHRDVLGSVMGLGIKREHIGDILNTQKGQVIFVKFPADQVVLNDLKRIGREAVSCIALSMDQVPEPIRNFREIKGTVKSLRLDSVVSLCGGISREKGKILVEKEQVMVDAVMRSNPAFSIPMGCILSIRGYGKFKIDCDGHTTTKGRYFITANKYI